MSKINEAIEQMSVEEMKQRLASYMAADKDMPQPNVTLDICMRKAKELSKTIKKLLNGIAKRLSKGMPQPSVT